MEEVIDVPVLNLRGAVAQAIESLILFAAFVTNAGTGILIDWMDGTIASPHTEYLEWGTSATVAAKTDTGNGAAGTEARVAATRVQSTITNTQDAFSYTGTIITVGGVYPRTYREVALFTALAAGTCIGHANVSDITCNAAGDRADFTVTLQAAN